MYGRLISLLAIIALLFVWGCGNTDGGTNTGYDPGITPGGAQDFNYVRNLISSGIIPDPDDFIVEGLLSEYDLPLETDGISDTTAPIQIRSACGYAPDNDLPDGGLYLQVGFSSNMSGSFARNPLNISIVLDISGSMNSYSKLGVAKRAVSNIIDQLSSSDILSIVLFNNEMHILQQPDSVRDGNAIKALLEDVTAGGSTNMDVGLRRGFNYVRLNADNNQYSHRVFLFTDAMPNSGSTSSENFLGIVSSGADEFIGLTAVGVGLDFDQSLIDYIGNMRGGNYFYIDNNVHSDSLFENEFDYIVTPVAYDVSINIHTRNAFRLSETYGFPSGDESQTSTSISTLFLSRRKGGVLFRFSRDESNGMLVPDDITVADISLNYTGTNLTNYTIYNYSAAYGGDAITNINQAYYEQQGVRLGILLTREVMTMKHVCEEYYVSHASPDYCIEMLQDMLSYLISEDSEIDITDLSRETNTIEELIVNFDDL